MNIYNLIMYLTILIIFTTLIIYNIINKNYINASLFGANMGCCFLFVYFSLINFIPFFFNLELLILLIFIPTLITDIKNYFKSENIKTNILQLSDRILQVILILISVIFLYLSFPINLSNIVNNYNNNNPNFFTNFLSKILDFTSDSSSNFIAIIIAIFIIAIVIYFISINIESGIKDLYNYLKLKPDEIWNNIYGKLTNEFNSISNNLESVITKAVNAL